MPGAPAPLRIAHAYGNNRAALRRALSVPEVDMIETDLWYRGGELYIHHEKRLPLVPLLYDRVMRGHPPGPYAARFGRYYVRPDIGTLRLRDLLGIVPEPVRLLLDVKGRYTRTALEGYVRRLLKTLRSAGAENRVTVCGQTYPVLNLLRRVAPEIEVRYSIEKEYQWQKFLRMMARDARVRNVCIAYGFIDAAKARAMEENAVDLYCWTVDDWHDAQRLVRQGVDGIISNDLRLLAALHGMANSAGSFSARGA
jgi:glycerophosphoryl diester phosphodiesterase